MSKTMPSQPDESLVRLEDVEDSRVAEERLTELRDGRSRTYTLDEVENRLGLIA